MTQDSICKEIRSISEELLKENGESPGRPRPPDFEGWDLNLDKFTWCPLCGQKVAIPVKVHLTYSHNIVMNLDKVLSTFTIEQVQDLEAETTEVLKTFFPEPRPKMPAKPRSVKTQTDPFIMLGNFQKYELKEGPNYIRLKKKSIIEKALSDAGLQVRNVRSIPRGAFQQARTEGRVPIVVKLPKVGKKAQSEAESSGGSPATAGEESRSAPPIPKLKITRVGNETDSENALDPPGSCAASTESEYRVTPVFNHPEPPTNNGTEPGRESAAVQGQPVKVIRLSLKPPKSASGNASYRSLLKKNHTRANILRSLKNLKAKTSGNGRRVIPKLLPVDPLADLPQAPLPYQDAAKVNGIDEPGEGCPTYDNSAADVEKPEAWPERPTAGEEVAVAPKKETFREWSRGRCKFYCGVCGQKDFYSSYDLYKHVDVIHSIDVGQYRKDYPNVYVEKNTITCQVCSKPLTHDISKLTQHISGIHKMSLKSYYDKYV